MESKRKLEIISQAIQEINSSLNLDTVMDLIYKNIKEVMDVSFFIISSYDQENMSVTIEYCIKQGKLVNEDFTTSINNSTSLTAWTIKNNCEIIINDLESDYYKYLSGQPKLHGKEDLWCESVIMIPLLVKNKIIGLFSVQNQAKNSYSQSDIELLRLMSDLISTALNNSKIYKDLDEANTEISKQKVLIEQRNKDITDSINYAKRIQLAKLPKREEIYSALPDSFVLFKPKDIVSGDFYYFHKNDNSVFIASADCTGHGVPGAFMSMIGSEKLDDALAQSTDTSVILQLLNKGIKTSLKQSDSDESTRDGMDIALCSVDTDTSVVKYAGANRPLWIIRNGQTEVEEIKATKTAIGGLTEDNQHFDTHEIKLKQGDTFYICTDGYADQFSGHDEKKLMTRKFKEILVNIQNKTMQEQESYLDNFMENWKAGIEQVDDILVIGVRL